MLYVYIIISNDLSAGLAVQNVTFTANSVYIISDGILTLTVSWDVGTDIIFEIDFGDGSSLYEWNWQLEGHTSSYRALRYVNNIMARFP